MFLDNSIFPKTHGNNCKLKFLGWPKDSNNQSTVPFLFLRSNQSQFRGKYLQSFLFEIAHTGVTFF